MLKPMTVTTAVILGTLILLIAMLWGPFAVRVEVLGISRSFHPIRNIHGEDVHVISNTLYCEDLHYHRPSNLLFTACESNDQDRWKWWPALVMIILF
jgi:hypothetical protein